MYKGQQTWTKQHSSKYFRSPCLFYEYVVLLEANGTVRCNRMRGCSFCVEFPISGLEVLCTPRSCRSAIHWTSPSPSLIGIQLSSGHPLFPCGWRPGKERACIWQGFIIHLHAAPLVCCSARELMGCSAHISDVFFSSFLICVVSVSVLVFL